VHLGKAARHLPSRGQASRQKPRRSATRTFALHSATRADETIAYASRRMAAKSSPSASRPAATQFDYELLASQLIRRLRGRRSCAEFSRRAGYRSNVVHRWESGVSFPSAATYIGLHGRFRPREADWIRRFFNMSPDWAQKLDPASAPAVATFLNQLRGKTPILAIANKAARNRYSVARWLAGSSEPRLDDFLRLVDVSSRRLLDLLAAFEDPTDLPAVRSQWHELQLARSAAYEFPWSHAVLRALELAHQPQGRKEQTERIAMKLGVPVAEVEHALRILVATGQVRRSPKGYRPRQVMVTDTSQDQRRAHELKVSWTETALARMRARVPGKYGYSLFAVSTADFARLAEIHLQYVRAMQDIIARSAPSECVGLYCAQLLNLEALSPGDR
jgi:DNA-binding transcriptional regulator YiaG